MASRRCAKLYILCERYRSLVAQNNINSFLSLQLHLTSSYQRTIPGSSAQGSSGKLRLTNLTQLTVDTSFWTRYRIDNENPDLDPNFVFPQAVNPPNGIKNRPAFTLLLLSRVAPASTPRSPRG
jgi:hypothetical protein